MAQLPMDKIHPAMDMPHLLLKDTVLATVTPILPHHMDTALPATAPLFMDMNLLMAQLPMDKIHLAMDMPHLLLKDTVLATVTPILPHHMDTPMDTVLPATALIFMDMNLLMAQLPMDKIHPTMDMPHLLLKDTVLATVTPILPHHMDTPMDTVLPATAPLFMDMNL